MVALILSSSVLLFWLSYFVQGQTLKSIEVCMILPIQNVTYSCESQEMIHVISVLHQEASPSCDPVPGGCQVVLESSADGLTTDCNGQQTCTTVISAFSLKQRCENINESLAMVSYECIREQPINMCSVRHAQATTTLYLTSPSFPRGTGSGVTQSDDPCVCTITGTDMSVEILEVYFLFDPQVRANLTLEGDNDFWDSTNIFLMYNMLGIAKTNHIKLTYDAKGISGQDAWIIVQGLGNITVDCNPIPATSSTTATTSAASTTYGETTTNAARQSNNVIADLTSTSSVHVDTTTRTVDSVKLGDSNTPAIIGVLCGVMIILLLAVAALVVYIKCVKPRRLLKSASASPETTDGNYDHNTQDQIIRTNTDYADMTHYINIDNVYTGLGPQEDNPEHLPSPGNIYAHPQIYSNEENSHEYSQLSHEQKSD